MNLLYCGDSNIEDGLLLSILSLRKNIQEPLQIYILTMCFTSESHRYLPVSNNTIMLLNRLVKETNETSFVKKIDVGALFHQHLPTANLETRFTPYCMLRLFADLIPELPDRILYLDNDVLCRMDFQELYYQNMDTYEFAGVLDYYGKWFFHQKIFSVDYMNSGVLLLNLKKIRETGLFQKCRILCQNKKMFMPDQSAINKLATAKKRLPRRYNEQRKLRQDTVLQHFTTSFRLFPWLHTLTIKPWHVERVHKELKLHEYDDLLEQYQHLKCNLKNIL